MPWQKQDDHDTPEADALDVVLYNLIPTRQDGGQYYSDVEIYEFLLPYARLVWWEAQNAAKAAA